MAWSDRKKWVMRISSAVLIAAIVGLGRELFEPPSDLELLLAKEDLGYPHCQVDNLKDYQTLYEHKKLRKGRVCDPDRPALFLACKNEKFKLGATTCCEHLLPGDLHYAQFCS